jgi:hypothetical protein
MKPKADLDDWEIARKISRLKPFTLWDLFWWTLTYAGLLVLVGGFEWQTLRDACGLNLCGKNLLGDATPYFIAYAVAPFAIWGFSQLKWRFYGKFRAESYQRMLDSRHESSG